MIELRVQQMIEPAPQPHRTVDQFVDPTALSGIEPVRRFSKRQV